jgi:ankyrin repeat protein
MTPLMHAAGYNPSPAVITALVQAGAKVDDRDKDGLTPLLYAATNSSPAVVTALMQAGANVDGKAKYGLTPLMMAAAFNETPQCDSIILTLLKAGADPKLVSEDNKTAFDYYVEKHNGKKTAAYSALKNGQR